MNRSSEQKEDNDDRDEWEKKELRKTYEMKQDDEVSKTMTENYTCRYLRTLERKTLREIRNWGKNIQEHL